MTICRETKKDRKVKVTIFIVAFILLTFSFLEASAKEKEAEIPQEIISNAKHITEEDISCITSEPVIILEEVIEFSIPVPLQDELILEEYVSEKEIHGLTKDEYELLCMLVHAESGRVNEKEMVAIAATVLNRIENDGFEDSVKTVIFEENQFSTAQDGNIMWFPIANQESVLSFNEVNVEIEELVKKALEGEDPTECIGGALFFYSEKYISEEERAKREGKIKDFVKYGDTVFYREYI